MGLCLGIDAANIRLGGGRTYLIELLAQLSVVSAKFTKIVVWGSQETLDCLPENPLISKVYCSKLDGSLLSRTLWQIFELPVLARKAGCNLLFIPGGVFVCNFRPIVTVSLNLLPFVPKEIARYGLSFMYIKMWLLRWLQARSFRNSAGLIFLANYPREVINAKVRRLPKLQTVVPLGVSNAFKAQVRPQKDIGEYSPSDPYRVVYVSSLHPYKNHQVLIAAIAKLREATNWPIHLEIVGPGSRQQIETLRRSINDVGGTVEWIKYSGEKPYQELCNLYRESDLGVFSSSCENMPNILVEMMASCLPIVCSHTPPMPDILENCGFYFDPFSEQATMTALKNAITQPPLRAAMAEAACKLAENYSWEKATLDTFDFMESIALESEHSRRLVDRN
jgi:glycosyltransferase involved in cell wall biosynthesis